MERFAKQVMPLVEQKRGLKIREGV
jgi:hypothetical protein